MHWTVSTNHWWVHHWHQKLLKRNVKMIHIRHLTLVLIFILGAGIEINLLVKWVKEYKYIDLTWVLCKYNVLKIGIDWSLHKRGESLVFQMCATKNDLNWFSFLIHCNIIYHSNFCINHLWGHHWPLQLLNYFKICCSNKTYDVEKLQYLQTKSIYP